MRTKCIIYFFLVSFYSLTTAQDKLDFTTALDAVYLQQHNQVSYETLIDQLWEFYQQPIDLNNTSKEELKQLHILSEDQLNKFFAHLYKNGALVSIYELQAIPGFDLATIERLLPFVEVEEVYPQQTQGLKNFLEKPPTYGHWLGRYERIVETQQGYEISKKSGEIPYKGSADKLATRLKWRHPNGWGVGIATKKYPGEPFTWDPGTARYGFDVWTAYLSLENRRYLKKLVIGNYQIGYGQGLVVNAGFNMDKSGETIPIIRTSNSGIKPHSSFSSYGFRGIATTLNWKSLEQSIYYAYNSLDGKALEDDSTHKIYTESMQRGGLHRTTQEISKKSQINEQIIGSTLVYKPKNQQTEVGINTVYNQYTIPIRHSIKELPYNFSGKENFNIGLFYRHLWHSLHFFGECAFSKSGGKGGLLGVVASLSASLELSLLMRHYDAHFHSFYGDAFRENSSGNHNEKGMYIGIGIQPIKKLKINAYYDYFYFPQPTTRIAQASSGYDWLTKATYQINRTHVLLFQYREAEKAKTILQPKIQSQQGTEKKIAKGKNRKYKAQCKQQLNSLISLHSEIQASTYTFLEKFTWGYAMAQSITYKLKKISATGQVAWFDADFDNRLYLYEKSPVYSKAMPSMYYKKGIKAYILLAYRPTINWRIEGKYNITWYPDEDHIGSGQEKIHGNTKNEVRLQLIYKF